MGNKLLYFSIFCLSNLEIIRSLSSRSSPRHNCINRLGNKMSIIATPMWCSQDEGFRSACSLIILLPWWFFDSPKSTASLQNNVISMVICGILYIAPLYNSIAIPIPRDGFLTAQMTDVRRIVSCSSPCSMPFCYILYVIFKKILTNFPFFYFVCKKLFLIYRYESESFLLGFFIIIPYRIYKPSTSITYCCGSFWITRNNIHFIQWHHKRINQTYL